MRKKSGSSWRPVVGAMGVCLLAYGLSLQGAPGGRTDSSSLDQKDLATSALDSSALQVSPPDKIVGPLAFSPKKLGLGELGDIRFGIISSIVPAGGTPQALNMDSGSANFYAAEGAECKCDSECPAPVSQCSRANCLNGVCREIFRPNNSWCDDDGVWCTQDRCDGGGNCQARALSRCTHECNEASSDTGNTCTSTGSCNPGACVPVGVCNEGLQQCELDPDVGRCCSGATSLTCAYISETACDGLSGTWLRIADTDDIDDSCFCPLYGSGIAPRGAVGIDLGPVRPSSDVCAGALAENDDVNDPIRRCVDPELDCPKRCAGGGNAGEICSTDPDCPNSNCGFDICVEDPNSCKVGFRELGDDYKSVNGSFIRLKQLRIHGGVENSREILTFMFYDDSNPPVLVNTQAFIFNTRGSGNDYITFDFDCAPDCNIPRNEDARDQPFVIPPAGFVVMRTIRNLGQNPSGGTQEPGEFGNGHWITTDAVDVGDIALANDPTVLWIDGAPTTNLPPGVTTGILSFELVGEEILDPKGACCDPDILGGCTDTNLWECRECTRETDPDTRKCSEGRDCGLTDFCIEPNWHGPRTQADVAGNVTDLCAGGICNSGSCCLPDGSCTVTAPETCEDPNGLNGTFNTPGGNCDPNCCTQPDETGGDCCGDISLCENGGSTLEDEDCNPANGNADCDQNLGRCTDGKICLIDVNSCADASQCLGPNTCSFCLGAIDTVLVIPSFGLGINDPARTLRKTLTGTTTDTFFGRVQGDTCTLDFSDDGWYEKFSFQGHCESNVFATGGPPCEFDRDCNLGALESCVGGCAVLTLNFCCSSPLVSPVFIGVNDVTETCLCDEFTDFVTVTRNEQGIAQRGFGLGCDHDDFDTDPDAQACCQDGNYSLQFELKSGTYYYQISASKFCQNSVNNCSSDDECVGVPCTTEGQDYQMHITATPCRRAACCLNIPCETNADCLGVYTSTCNTTRNLCESSCLQTTKLECEGDVLNGITPPIPGDWLGDLDQPAGQCSSDGTPVNNVCKTGICCTGPGACNEETDPTVFTNLEGCVGAGIDNVYHGGITCAENPCPVCPFEDPGHCQTPDPATFIQASDRQLGRRLVDDIRVPANGVIDRVCWWGCWTPPQFPEDLPACDASPPNNNEDWQIVFYDDALGFPNEASAVTHNVIPDAAASIDGVACWDMSAEISPPLQVVGGACIWVEITGNGTPTCTASLRFSDDGNTFSYRDADGNYGVEDLDTGDYTFCVSSGITPGSVPFDDGGCGDLTGACCTIEPGSPPACDDSGSLSTRSACQKAFGNFVVNGVCGPNTCPNPANDLCEDAEPVCAGIMQDEPPDPDIGVCFGLRDQPCLKSAGPGQLGSCDILGQDFGPCFNIPAESSTATCTFATDNRLAQTDGPGDSDETCGQGDFNADVWYTMTSPCTGRMMINMCGAATYDGMLSVWGNQTETCVACPLEDATERLACNDDFCAGQFSTASSVTVDVLKAACYTIRVGGWSGLGTAFDAGQSISEAQVIITCDAIVDSATPKIPAAPHDIRKNRFVSIDPNNDTPVSLRIQLLDNACSTTSLKCGVDGDCKTCDSGPDANAACIINSDCLNVTGEPASLCVVSGETCVQQTSPVTLGWAGDPTDASAGGTSAPAGTMVSLIVASQPTPRLWTEAVVHLMGCPVAPGEIYGISATTDGTAFSDPLVVGTIFKPQGKDWGDLVGNFTGVFWTPPNGLVGVDDVSAILKFITLKNAPHITVLDLAGKSPRFVNFLINATDLGQVLRSFKGEIYPSTADKIDGYPPDRDVTLCPPQ